VQPRAALTHFPPPWYLRAGAAPIRRNPPNPARVFSSTAARGWPLGAFVSFAGPEWSTLRGVGEDRTGATGADCQRLTVPQAAEALGVTVDAVRGRIRRGKLEAEHDEAGTVYVWIDALAEVGRRGPSPTSQRLVRDRRPTWRSASRIFVRRWPTSESSCSTQPSGTGRTGASSSPSRRGCRP
jgi:hypothetical protein